MQPRDSSVRHLNECRYSSLRPLVAANVLQDGLFYPLNLHQRRTLVYHDWWRLPLSIQHDLENISVFRQKTR
jgi:hypothetical protein